MRFSEADDTSGNLITAYDAEGVVVGRQRYLAGLIVTPTQIVAPWAAPAAALTITHLEQVLALAPQVILLGTGTQQIFLAPQLQFAVLQRGIGLEVMNSAAACRTYNILAAEGRRVAVALTQA
ncbi:hypothetical protein CKO12_11530 [Chromatium okenii]|uniref:Mth938-like domain-containing protein n=1 Tax=Chromatium okenii TaxID=61644 RepID=UPI001905AE58|nr:MTH938/NDUFAF3 family protein [Chromatium okenii]MBK1642497.1 hypothetical protein [Chromatium okenii]